MNNILFNNLPEEEKSKVEKIALNFKRTVIIDLITKYCDPVNGMSIKEFVNTHKHHYKNITGELLTAIDMRSLYGNTYKIAPNKDDIIVSLNYIPKPKEEITKPKNKVTKQYKQRLVKRLLKAYLKVEVLPTISQAVKAIKNDYIEVVGTKLTVYLLKTEYKGIYKCNSKSQITGLK